MKGNGGPAKFVHLQVMPLRTSRLFRCASDLVFVPIQEDARGGVEVELVAFLEGAPAMVIGLGVKDDLLLRSSGEVVEEDKVGRLVELLGADAVLGEGEFDPADLKAGFFQNFTPKGLFG